ncbi:unnamed protein product [Didymodactylos carnosus]|uniref:Condensation domain-containing protein n=1 Tax=Didymodactylos carnosus TaxID=1234261 RepID=A0A814UIZ1_9BILA|nr:unnamed protein product [Didymodactylos carnosus]CAF1175066.1 unnamed protein product [Didymodactylos carnosus]CAF3690836.1 unnamed protein product [Didymodactylos carnosus]CAF3938966.1 unnamed protein product [Didymodactylos carnosus]
MFNTKQLDRPLGWLEALTVDANLLVVGVCELEFSSTITGGFDKQRLQSALHRCIDCHHSLRMNTTPAKPYHFQYVTQPYSTPSYIEFEGGSTDDDDEWQQIVNREMNEGFEMGSEVTSLFKLVVLHNQTNPTRQFLLMKYHHSIADGISGMIILHTLLSFYFDSGDPDNGLTRLADNETLAFPQVTEEVEKQTEQMRTEVLTYKRQWTPTIPYEVVGNTIRNSALYFNGTQENMDKLMDRCHEEKVTLGSVLLASTYFAIAELVKEKWLSTPSATFSNFKFDVDVNLRHRYPAAADTPPLSRYESVGLHVGMMNLNDITVSLQTQFWQLCHVIHQQLTQNLVEGKHLTYLRANRLCSTDILMEEQVQRNHGRSSDLNVSNIGKYPFQQEYDDGHIKLKHYYCAGSGWCPFNGTNVLLVCSMKSLDYTLVYETGTKNEEIAKHWFQKMTSLTEAAAETDAEDLTFERWTKDGDAK